MEGFQSCSDISDVKPFYPKRQLFLKPLLKINISIQLPSLKLVGKSISNVTLMEHIKNWASPDKFCSIKVTKSTLEFIRFEADLLNPSKVQAILARLDGKQVTLPGFKEIVKVRASIAKSDFPSRHDWDSFFRDAKHMNEMKAGERPDTLHLSDLPNKWFSTKSKEDLPSESLLKKIFQQFGEVTAVDIPSVDPYRSKMKAHISGLKLFNFNQNSTFEAYIQYRDYISFVKAMDCLRGMKLLRIESDEAFSTNIKVDFDKTKHLSENSIRKRKIEREKLMARDRDLEEKKQKLEDALKKLEEKEKEKQESDDKEAKIETIEEKQERRKKRNLKDCDHKNEESIKIINEKKLLLAAQRKLESIRILTELLRLIKVHKDLSTDKERTRTKPESSYTDTKDNEKIVESKLEEETFTAELKNIDSNVKDRSRLHSEVVKVDRPAPGITTDYKSRKHDVPVTYYKRNGEFTKWRRYQGPNGDRKNDIGIINSRRNFIQHNTDYYRNTHRLYYKYFQSLTRNGPRTSDSNSHSRSRSKSRTHDIQEDHYSRSRSISKSSPISRSRSRSYRRNSLEMSRKSFSKTRSDSNNWIKSETPDKSTYLRYRSNSRNRLN